MAQPTVEEFLSTYAIAVQEIAHPARAVLLKAIPDCAEELDAKAKVIGYGYGPGYSDTVCVLLLSKTGVKLGLPEGASLPDPEHLLDGAGRRHRHVRLTSPQLIKSPPVRALIAAALGAYRARRKGKS
jgi:hypothetical protein